MPQDDVIVVFTATSIEGMLKEGGSCSWRLSRARASQCALVLCTRNAHSSWTEGSEAHQSAFLIAKVRDVVPCEPTPENHAPPGKRFLIQFSEFALVNIPNVWKGYQNPVKYLSLEALDIKPLTLDWEVVPEAVSI